MNAHDERSAQGPLLGRLTIGALWFLFYASALWAGGLALGYRLTHAVVPLTVTDAHSGAPPPMRRRRRPMPTGSRESRGWAWTSSKSR